MKPNTLKVVLVEDNASDAFLLQETLLDGENCQFEVQHLDRLSNATPATAKWADVVLLDLSLPDSFGMVLFRW